MRTNIKIICKLFVLIAFLLCTPFIQGAKQLLFTSDFLNTFVYHQKNFEHGISIKNQLNLLANNQNLTIDEPITFETTQEVEQKPQSDTEETQKEDTTKENEATIIDTGKRVYIYNTHQSESYANQEGTVMDAAAILGNKLEEKGIHVVLETANFASYMQERGWDYNDSYKASYDFLNDALAKYGGFDLIIDLHRDAIPREASYFRVNDKNYAKLMFVVGGLSKNAAAVTEMASTLTDIIESKQSGIMRSTMTREAYYNQEVSERMLLIECGGDVNPFDEVKNSMEILADGIYDLLVR